MAASAWAIHNKVKEYIGNKIVDLDNDSLKINLYLSTSDLAVTKDGIATVSDQVATANGYTQNTKAIASQAWTSSGATCTFDCADVVWTAAGGSITARYAAIYDDTVTAAAASGNVTAIEADPIICSCTLDTTPADVTATDTNTFTIAMHASGVFTLA